MILTDGSGFWATGGWDRLHCISKWHFSLRPCKSNCTRLVIYFKCKCNFYVHLYCIRIALGGYAVIGAAAFSGAVTHTISTCLIVFELTGQLSHIIPCIIAVWIANAIAQSLYPSIYDSIIQIKKLPFLPNISSTSSAAHSIFVEDIMVRDVVYAWMGCTYNDLRKILKTHKQIQSFPLVDSPQSMILLGSVQRQELQLALSRLVVHL